jgi:AP-2 complex subunit alpha
MKKYVWKLLYMYMLGYDTVGVAHMTVIKLITMPRFSEKNCGYVALATLLNENHDFLRLTIQNIRSDMESTDEIFQCLALSVVANVGGKEMAESLSPIVQRILLDSKSTAFVRKKAALCMLRLIRKSPECAPQDEFPAQVIALLNDGNVGVLCSVASLLLGLVSITTQGYEDLVPSCIKVLDRIRPPQNKPMAQLPTQLSNYKYYFTICPWLQVKLLRILQFFPPPPADSKWFACLFVFAMHPVNRSVSVPM